jgi:SMI1/KNR4 family protein SUKH-1
MWGYLMDVAKFIAQIDRGAAPKPTAAALEEFEKRIGCKLPDDYRQFLLACAGGYCGGSAEFNWPQGHWAGAVQTVWGLRQDSPDYSLVHTRDAPQWPTVDELLWIMSDHGGNPICMTIDPEHFGEIWFVDHEVAEYDKDWTLAEAISEDWGYVLPLAPSFGRFIAGLYEDDDTA